MHYIEAVAIDIIFSGIDDMFVIMQSLYNLGDQFNGNVVDTLSAALERSGVAITVTSLTDVLAFGVGATTVSITIISNVKKSFSGKKNEYHRIYLLPLTIKQSFLEVHLI